jgi:pimeloyl-ACP methyl ester carboxylesterase
MAGDLQKLMTALGIERAYLVGHSYGGVIGMHVAQETPERVAGVILSDSYFPGLAHLEPNVADAGPWHDLRRDLARVGAEIGETVDFDRLFEAVAEMEPAQFDAYKKQLGPPAARWLSQLSQLLGTTAGKDLFEVAGLTAERIASVQQPVIALYDEHTPFVATSRWLAENVPHCQVDIVPGAKHVAPLQNSAGFVERVQRHLRAMNAS